MQIRSFILGTAAATVLTVTSVGQIHAAFAADPSSTSADPATRKQARGNNHALEHAVRQSFSHVKGLDSSGINVIARGDTITLAGSAPDQSQIESAVAAASKVSGVSRVDNRLTIEEPGH